MLLNLLVNGMVKSLFIGVSIGYVLVVLLRGAL